MRSPNINVFRVDGIIFVDKNERQPRVMCVDQYYLWRPRGTTDDTVAWTAAVRVGRASQTPRV